MPRVSDEHKQLVRDQLLDAAGECLHELGYERTTTREILRRAGLSAGSLYHYFGGKEELFAALADRIFHRDIDALVPSSDGGSMAATLDSLVGRLFDPANSSTLLPQLRARAPFEPELARALSRWDDKMVGAMSLFVRTAQDEGVVREDLDASALVEVVIIFFEGLRTRQAAGAFATSFDRTRDTFLELLVGAALPGNGATVERSEGTSAGTKES
jgi:AcrR family transcriptional regulator